MARPEKHNAEYFSHDKNMRNDPKIKALRRKFPKEGYSVWNMFLEVLTEADFFTIEINPINIELMAGDFDVEPEILSEIINYCGKIKLLDFEENKVFSCGLKKRLQPVLDNRNAVKQRFLDKKLKEAEVSKVDNTQSKVKESKVKYTIKEVVEEEEISEFFPEKSENEKTPEKQKNDVFMDEEEKLAAVEFLKLHSMFNLIQKQQGLKPPDVIKHFETFYDTKLVLGELRGRTRDDVLKNFLFWIPSQMSRVKKSEGNGNTNNSSGASNNSGRRTVSRADNASLNAASRSQLVSGLRSLLQGTEPKE